MEDEELNEDDLISMITNDCEDDSDEGTTSDTFTPQVVCLGLELGRKLCHHFLQNDPNVERSLQFQTDINQCLAQYKEVYKDLTHVRTQALMTDFLTKPISPENVGNQVTVEAESPLLISSDESA